MQILLENVTERRQVLEVRIVPHAVVRQRGHERLIKAKAHTNGREDCPMCAEARGDLAQFLGIDNPHIGLTIREQDHASAAFGSTAFEQRAGLEEPVADVRRGSWTYAIELASDLRPYGISHMDECCR